MTSRNWKGALTAEIFQYGFEILEKDCDTLDRFSKRDIKRFFDKLCGLFAPALE